MEKDAYELGLKAKFITSSIPLLQESKKFSAFCFWPHNACYYIVGTPRPPPPHPPFIKGKGGEGRTFQKLSQMGGFEIFC